MIRPLDIFKIRREERLSGMIVLTVFLLLNALFVAKYYALFTPVLADAPMKWCIVHHFEVSGFDPITLTTISIWRVDYDVYRHPLLAFLVYPLYLLNMLCQSVFGINCAIFIAAALMTACAFYSFIFIHRIFSDIFKLKRFDTELLSAFFFSLGYVMVTVFTSDHFGLSMVILLIVLYVSGMRMMKHKLIPTWQMTVLYTFTTGITTTNCFKIILAQLFVNGRRFFFLKNILLAIALPSLLLGLFCVFEYRTYVLPVEQLRNEINAKRHHMPVPVKPTDNNGAVNESVAAFGSSVGWRDNSISRLNTTVDNLFGEPIQLHSSHLLGDIYNGRPVFVAYNYAVNYVVEALIVALFVVGIWFGRRNRLLWLCLSWFAMDMVVHIGFTFGIREVYIMSPHWLFIFPIAIACIFSAVRGFRLKALRTIMLCLTAFLLLYNGTLVVRHLLSAVSVH